MIVINKLGKAMTVRQANAHRIARAMIKKTFTSPDQFQSQVDSILSWSNEAVSAIERILNRSPDIV